MEYNFCLDYQEEGQPKLNAKQYNLGTFSTVGIYLGVLL